MAQHYYTVTWDQLHRDARALAWRLIGKGKFAGVVAITRGGLIPAAIVARELDLRVVESVSVVTYDEEAKGEPVVAKLPAAAGTTWSIPARRRGWCAACCRGRISRRCMPSRRGGRWLTIS
jgi:hypothetical protein